MGRNETKYVACVLAEYLAEGPKPYSEVKNHCRELGITTIGLRAARRELGVKTINTGTTWFWYVPDSEEKGDA